MGTSSDEKLTPFSRITREAVEWVVPGLVPAGMLTVLAGPQGLGKSLLYFAWAAQLAEQGMTTIVVNGEDSKTHTSKPRVEALGADGDLILNANIMPVFGNGNGEQWYREIGEWIFSTRARLLILDPLAAFLDSQADVFRDHHVRRLLEPLGFIAAALNCAIVYVKHVKKGQESDLLSRVTDSVAFTAAARSVVMMAREGEYRSRLRLVCHAKCNVAELAPIQQWEVVPILLPVREDLPEVRTARLEYRGLAEDANLDSLYRPHSPEAETDLEQAFDLIRELLAEGEAPSRDLENAASAMGISHPTMMEARKRLGVVASQKSRSWFVHLPTSQSQTVRVRPPSDSEESLQMAGDLGQESARAQADSESAQGSLDWIGTASWAELQKGLDS